MGEENRENLCTGFATSYEYKYNLIRKCCTVEDYATRQAKFIQIDVSVITFKLILLHYVIKILSCIIIVSVYLNFTEEQRR